MNAFLLAASLAGYGRDTCLSRSRRRQVFGPATLVKSAVPDAGETTSVSSAAAFASVFGRSSIGAVLCAVAALAVGLATPASAGEVRFGPSHWVNLFEYSRQGRFFATTDYADSGYDYGRLTRGRTGGGFPSSSRPWMSSGAPTLFGLRFEAALTPNLCLMNRQLTPPDQFEHWFEDGMPLFDRVQIFWAEHVPEPHTWSASIRRPDGRLVRLDPDNARRIYPYDRTTLEFEPMPVEAVFIGVRERPDGRLNVVSVRDLRIHLHEAMPRDVTNALIVAQPDLYRAHYSTTHPGMIDSLQPVNIWQWGPTPIFRWLTPFVEFEGERFEPVEAAGPVAVDRAVSAYAEDFTFEITSPRTGPTDLTLDYALTFELPGVGPSDLAVTARFRRDPQTPVVFTLRGDRLPEGARIGYRFHGPEQAFGSIAETSPRLPASPTPFRTPAGWMAFDLDGAEAFDVAYADGVEPVRDWNGDPVRFVRFETLTEGAELTLTFSLPFGLAGAPQPEMLNFDWRPSTATEAEAGHEWLRPFRMSDLELLETIEVGDPDGAHVFIDSRNDPVVRAAFERYGADWQPPGGQTLYGFLPFAHQPEEGAVPLVEIDGQTARAIPDRRGSYFRYDLNTRLLPRTAYLVVIEHAFDRQRRGAFHSIAINEQTEQLVLSRGLYGGFETDPDDPDGGFRKEYVLCYFNGLGWPSLNGMRGLKNSLVFSNTVFSGGLWQRVDGLAIRRIRLYRVHQMPALPDLTPVLPPAARQRSVLIWNEHDRGSNPWYLFGYPKLLGYSAIWSNNHQSLRFFGGAPVRLTQEDQSFSPGRLAGTALLLEAAEAQGVSVNLHLGQLMKMGFEGTDYESFQTATYMFPSIPLKPTDEERAHIAAALRHAMPLLSPYRSFRDVSTFFWPQMPFSRRNLSDFVADTGAPLSPSPLAIENIQALLNAGPERLREWTQWACERYFAFNQWLLDELRQYRPDLFLTLTRYWDHGLIEPSIGYDSLPGVSRRRLAEAGIVNFLDYLRFFGIDPDLYRGREGFSLEIEADSRLRTGREIPDYYETEWFRELKAGFDREGLSIMTHCATLEFYVPLLYYNCPFVAPPLEYRKGLIRALLHGNPRNLTLGSYNEPWGPRLADFREFAVAYRLLPFAAPEPFAGMVSDTAGQAVIRRYGDRHGLMNAGAQPTVVTLDLPEGAEAIIDLSGGTPLSLPVERGSDGRRTVEIAMPPWTLRTLELK